jgi:dihydroorotate dehydrogenase
VYALLKKILFRFDPERVHELVMAGLERVSRFDPALELLAQICAPYDSSHAVRLWDLEFPNPVGLAAGFDKNALALPAWPALGFGFVEMGSVTALAQSGNPTPRLFRLPEDGAIINRMGFNNHGAEAIAARLERLRQTRGTLSVPLGINLGKSKLTPLELAPMDYLSSLDKLWDYGDYFVINVSSPNTPNLRQLQDKDKLEVLLGAVMDFAKRQTLQKPVLLKVAPDLTFNQLEDVLVLLEQYHISGIVATNTTLSRAGLKTQIEEAGGLSGEPLKKRSLEFLEHLQKELDGRLPIISVGGISSGDDVQQRLDMGASLVQVYTGWIYQGPMMIKRMFE